jgi:hypothetical protein
MNLDKNKKIRLKFEEKPIMSIDSHICDQDNNRIATLFRETDMNGYNLIFYVDKSVDSIYIDCLPRGMQIVARLLKERGYNACF